MNGRTARDVHVTAATEMCAFVYVVCVCVYVVCVRCSAVYAGHSFTPSHTTTLCRHTHTHTHTPQQPGENAVRERNRVRSPCIR
jgi:hypothetical protein